MPRSGPILKCNQCANYWKKNGKQTSGTLAALTHVAYEYCVQENTKQDLTRHQWCGPHLVAVNKPATVTSDKALQNTASYTKPHSFHASVNKAGSTVHNLTHWGRHEIDAILQTTFSNTFSWMKMFKFRFNFHWSLFLRTQLTIFQHWFR